MTIRELLKAEHGNYDDWEVYEPFAVGNSDNRGFYSDYIRGIDDVDMAAEVINYEIMDEEDYNNSVLANTSACADFEEWYDDKGARVLCILVQTNVGY